MCGNNIGKWTQKRKTYSESRNFCVERKLLINGREESALCCLFIDEIQKPCLVCLCNGIPLSRGILRDLIGKKTLSSPIMEDCFRAENSLVFGHKFLLMF